MVTGGAAGQSKLKVVGLAHGALWVMVLIKDEYLADWQSAKESGWGANNATTNAGMFSGHY